MLIGYPLVFFFFFFFFVVVVVAFFFFCIYLFKGFGMQRIRDIKEIWDMGYQTLFRDIEKNRDMGYFKDIDWIRVYIISRCTKSRLLLSMLHALEGYLGIQGYGSRISGIFVESNFDAGLFAKFLTPACSWKMSITLKPFGIFW